MDRRDALKSLAVLAGATGIRVTPVTTREAAAAALIVLRPARRLSAEECAVLKAQWDAACTGTALAHVRTIVLDAEIEVELVRR